MPKGKLTDADNKFISKFLNPHNELNFDRAKILVLKLNADAYMTILD